MFGLAITPTLLTAGIGVVIGIGAAIAVSKFIDGTGYKKKAKRAWNSFWGNM